MAKMIPSQIDDSVVSSAERRVFQLLDSDPDTDGWTVLHSLGLARRKSGPYGEIDFVIIVPGEGVLCLEVKGGRVSCENGKWRTQDRYGNVSELKKSPFMQARESMFALRESILNHFGDGSPEASCPIGYVVVFPDVTCPPLTPEYERSDVIDTQDLRKPISRSIHRYAQNRLRGFQSRNHERLPSPSQVRSIRNFLRPDFDLVVAKSISLGRTESKLLSLTVEQYERLDELQENHRCLFEGAAGTGKTLLALEYARRADKSGARVLLVCFNRLLGEWLRKQTRDTGIKAGNWHEILKGIITASSVAEEFINQESTALENEDYTTLFDEIYPFYAELAFAETNINTFDVLVMDEAQDLFCQSTFELFNLAVKGGLAGGTWAVFGDFTQQALYNSGPSSMVNLSEYCEHFVKARLNLNCRNTRRIAEETALFGGFITPPFRYGQENGVPVEHRYWSTKSSLVKALTTTIGQLLLGGVSLDDIVVLSPRRLENSALGNIERIGDAPLFDSSRSLDVLQGSIRFSTIHSFKGLESQVVIIVDIDEVEKEGPQALMYVGMSRARSLLVLMISEGARRSVEARIKAGLEKELRT